MIIGFEEFKNLSVLYAEDDVVLQQTIGDTLRVIFGNVHIASNGAEALKIFNKHVIHVVMLDVRMGFMSGLEVAREIRKVNKKIPIFITSSYTETEDLLEACKLNLVDYIKKPFTFDHLKNVLFASLEQLKSEGSLQQKINEHIIYNPFQKVILKDGKKVSLTNNEIKLLTLLLKSRGQLISYETIANYIDENLSDGALKNIVMRLRKKMGDDSVISNLPKIGYILV